MEQNKETWQAFLEDSGYNVEIVQTCRVLNKAQMRLYIRKLLAQVKNPDRLKITRGIEANFRSELGAKDNNALTREFVGGDRVPRKIFVNTTDEALLFPELFKEYTKEINKAVGVSPESKEEAKYYLSLFYNDWQVRQQTAPKPLQGAPEKPQGAPEPPQVTPKPLQTRKKTRGKGRQMTPLTMIDDADGHKLEKMHQLLKGKIGKDVALYVLAAIKKGWMTRPTYTQVVNEFGDIGSKQGFNKYLGREKAYTNIEMEGAINSLE